MRIEGDVVSLLASELATLAIDDADAAAALAVARKVIAIASA